MTSLGDVYHGQVGSVASRRRVQFGLALFAVGAVSVVAAIVVATTAVAGVFGLGLFEARELAGVLAGLGIPAAFLGIFALLPASRRTRAAAVIGASLALLGVILFREAYPVNWIGGAGPSYTLPVVIVYFLGAITTFWCLFVAAATFKARNDPGGTVKMKVTDEGTTRILEVTGQVPGFGSVGLFGSTPDGEVETQTGDDSEVLYARDENPTPARSTPASDGGSATQSTDGEVPGEPDAEFVEAVQTRGQPDPYCGNCEHFQYVRVDGEIEPYCGLDETVMDNMDACEEWQANN